MPSFRSLDNNELIISTAEIEEFRSDFRGTLFDSDDADYNKLRQVWNGLIDKRPALIAQCLGTADVVSAINFARKHDVLLSVRGGGHNVSGSAICDGGMTVDLSLMRGVRVDRHSQSVHVQGGAVLGDIDRETQLFGLATTTGNVSETGVAGLTLGGGLGNLRRKYGLGIDNLVSVEIITANGQILQASERENWDLFWAIRGGGGNFGIVTSFEFRLFPLGPEVYFAAQFFDLDDAPVVFREWRDFMEAAPEEISSIAFFWTIPRVEAFPEELHGKRVFMYAALYSGHADEGEKATANLRTIGKPILDLSGRGPYCAWQSGFDPFFTRGGVYENIYAYWKSLYLGDLSDQHIEELVKTASTIPSEQCLIAIWHLGGAMSRVPEDATAFGKRSAPYLLSYDSCWTDSALNESVIAWTRAQVAAAESYAAGGLYLNFPGVSENSDELVRAAYGKNFDRLVGIKRMYDPDNLFRVNHNIRPG
ncbi:MAG: FAD-binding oxidoreductase [Granulosicoccus sp.]|nr:FAD-binding oxidoreductase [Granulosicoccus sp.]